MKGKLKGVAGLEGILNGLGELVEKLSGMERKTDGAIRPEATAHPGGKARGIYGIRVQFGLGGDDIDVETFGNVKQDRSTGHVVVDEVREPVCDLFEEDGYLLLVAEMPGVAAADLQLSLDGDLLTLDAERKDRKYHKELQLPHPVDLTKAQPSANNGVIEIRLPL
jgi:HSP20 family protein